MQEEGPSRETESGWFASKKRRGLLIAALLLCMFATVLLASLRDSPTFDEPIYIASGYQYLRGGNFTLNLEHPPLIKEVLAAPLACFGFNYSAPPEGGDAARYFLRQNAYAGAFLYSQGNPPDTMLQVARIPAYLMLVALGFLVYSWGKRLYGYPAGLISLTLFVLTPVFLGDGRLSVLDLGATLFFTAALYSIYLYLEKASPCRFLACSLATAAALLSRFNMFILIAILPALALSHPLFAEGGKGEAYGRGALRNLGRAAAITAAAMILVLTFYGMHTSRLTRDQQESNIESNLVEGSSFKGLLLSVNEVSPPLAHYLLGIAHDYEYVNANRVSYWNGSFSHRWRWYYYPWIFLLKTPLAAVLLFFLGLLVSMKRIRAWPHACPLLSLGLLAAATGLSKLQMGIRYVMPLFPLVLLLAGLGGAELVRAGRGRRYRVALLAALLAYAAASVAPFFPSFLSYSNELIPDKRQAYRWLIDSNLDWGQDLKRLADYAEENGIADLEIDYFGGGDPLYYLPEAEEWYQELADMRAALGFSEEEVRPHGWFALSLTRRQLGFWEAEAGALPRSPNSYGNWIMDHRPEAYIGDSIVLYHLP